MLARTPSRTAFPTLPWTTWLRTYAVVLNALIFMGIPLARLRGLPVMTMSIQLAAVTFTVIMMIPFLPAPALALTRRLARTMTVIRWKATSARTSMAATTLTRLFFRSSSSTHGLPHHLLLLMAAVTYMGVVWRSLHLTCRSPRIHLCYLMMPFAVVRSLVIPRAPLMRTSGRG